MAFCRYKVKRLHAQSKSMHIACHLQALKFVLMNLQVTPDEENHGLCRIHCCFMVVLYCTVCYCSSFVLSFCFHSGEFPSALSSFDSTFASETNIYYCLASHAKVEESFVENPAHEGIQNPDTAQSVKLNEHLV